MEANDICVLMLIKFPLEFLLRYSVLSDTPYNYGSKWKETTSSKSQGKKSKV